MKTRMQATKELKEQMRGATLEEVRAKRRELSDQMFRLRFQFAGGQTDTLRKIRELRRDIARVETILGEREAGKSVS
ncbi:MAG: 50S ribosomal protein L29 [Acidobacteria bacterium]|nr:MAG: 50S ribosomal protein L29 [Acidobacteriota bacterium]